MSIKAVLFDLDGTLLPMEQDHFVKVYFGGLAAKMVPHGYDKDELIKGVWNGTRVMVANQGDKTNEEAFWQYFASVFGENVYSDMPLFEEYYENEFDQVKTICGYRPEAQEVVSMIKEAGVRVILATNPLFPPIATRKRAQWAGLNPEELDHITTYDNSSYCKPNPEYYKEILAKFDLNPEECVMVGNDVSEDMIAADLGMKVFLLTDCLINKDEVDISVYPNGGFKELKEWIQDLMKERKTMTKNIIFDMGQVLIHWRPHMFTGWYNLTEEEEKLLAREVFQNIEWPQLDRGTITEEAATASVCSRLPEKFHPMVEEIIFGWWKPELSPMEGMADVVKALKDNGYNIYLLSNASIRLREYFHRIPGSEYFDGHVVSAEEKLLKPQKEIYQALFERYDLVPEECFFIDDSPYNIEGAYCAGMPGAVFHGDIEELKEKLKLAGIKID